ncbi:MAG TPA: heparan-alpha-glucosaminide N-acetyltransferase domain-containing protein [Lacibacter sp.]|nr:heparan-alpha-glucosaminide N-acetyltransferase domain-containing protein [Lacibacter sp.]HMO88646.1 heparan-alpha-glucosaminide N-acetyltransferase domain-containing protein [Lacibacter sp.]HMP85627.1 heparan-alpha-glucosaminide N-acetyltransferase domain-containing protein [Lacibacter sp.]
MQQRFYSLDVFRGATVALMILVNNPGSWSHMYAPLKHAPWHDCTPTDLVFPFFLFAVGNAMAFVMPRLQAGGPGPFWRKVLKRTVLIFSIGLLLHWSPFVKWSDNKLIFKTLENIRIMGVLQRIALCYFFASVLVYYLKPRGAFVAAGVLLLFYWVLCLWAGTPGDPYSLQGWFGTELDKAILGAAHLYKGEGVPFDPEGLMSSFAAIAQVIFGYLVGDYIQQKGKTYEMVTGLFVAATVLSVAGLAWGAVFPINKKIWTSSYTLYTTGLAIYTIATLIYLVEFRQVRGWWTRFFDVFGKNPLFIFVLSGFLPRLLGLIRIPNGFTPDGSPRYLSPFGWYYDTICKQIPGIPENGSLFYAVSMIVMYWAICYWLDRRKIYIKV